MGQTNQSELTVDWRSYLFFREERSANALEFSKSVQSTLVENSKRTREKTADSQDRPKYAGRI